MLVPAELSAATVTFSDDPDERLIVNFYYDEANKGVDSTG